MNTPRNHDNLPVTLRDALRASEAVPSASTLDGAMQAAIQTRFAGQRRLRILGRWGALVGVAAALLALLIVRAPRPLDTTPERFVQRVTILDAFTLARRLQADKPIAAHFDRNGDGQINQVDVNAWAQLAVRLGDDG